MFKFKSTIVCLAALLSAGLAVRAQEPLLDVLKKDMAATMKELGKKEYAPYYMNYRVVDERLSTITAAHGSIVANESIHKRTFVPQIRIGDRQFDNFMDQDMGVKLGPGQKPAVLPTDENGEAAIRQVLWDELCRRYDFAVDILKRNIANNAVNLEKQDKSPSFADAPVEVHYEKPLPETELKLDDKAWGEKLCKLTDTFKKYPKIIQGNATINYQVKRTYFISTEGACVVHNLRYARLMVMAQSKADDGMDLPMALSYFAFDPEDLPSADAIMDDVERLARTLTNLSDAPLVDAYTGPAILSGPASGVFFHEIFGHRIEGQRMRQETDGQTFRKKLGQYVLPKGTHVYDDPTLARYQDEDLNGYYLYDEQGVKAQRVEVVVDGKMNDFLMTRKPMEGFPKTNGHARAIGDFDPVSRQSNLVIESDNLKTEAELRQILIDEAKAQGKQFGYFIKQVNGGFTSTDIRGINSFNVAPLETYRVYVDGRPDELVRGVDIIGTPMSMFESITHFGGQTAVFTGMCGAESGWVPVTAVAPSTFVKKVELQRKAASKNLPPILEKP